MPEAIFTNIYRLKKFINYSRMFMSHYSTGI
jgi:hypothetical protein